MSGANVTTVHELIRRWEEERGGRPSSVEGTGGKDDAGLLGIDLPGKGEDDGLEEIDWDPFFATFDEWKLAFLYQDQTKNGKVSRFSKFIEREA